MIKITTLTKKIGNKMILSNVNLEMDNGLTFIVGDSGAGKSTLLNLVGSLDAPSEGEVQLICGENRKLVTEFKEYKSKYLGFIFQDSNLISGLSIRENMNLAIKIAGIKKTKTEINDMLDYFGLLSIADEKIECLSGGERQRAAIARAIIKEVPIILADEPTGSLDRSNSIQVFEMLKQMSTDRIVIVVSHNEEMARQYGDRIITMSDGKIVGDEKFQKKAPEVETKRYEKNNLNNKLGLDVIKLLTLNNINRFKAKFITIVLAIAIAISTVGIIFFMNFNIGEKTDELNTVYYDADLITFYSYALGEKNLTSIIMGSDYGAISAEMINEISESGLFKEVIPVCDVDYYMELTEENINIKLIKLDDFFEERLMLDDVMGDFPEDEGQIILGQDLADKYYGGNAIGETITIASDYGVSKTYDIVGINGEKNVDGVYYTYISAESISNMTFPNMFTGIYLAENVEDMTKTMYQEDASGFICDDTDGNIIYGDAPDGKSQMVVSTDIVRNIYYALTGEYVDFTFENVGNTDSDMESKLELVLNQEYYISANDAYGCSIVGVHSGGSDEVLVSGDWANTISCALPNKLECYCNDIQTAERFKEKDLASKCFYVSNYEERFENAVSTSGTFKLMFIIALIIVVLLTIVLIHSYSKIAVEGRLYEVGILNSLGLEKKEIKRVLATEIYLLGSMAGIVACIIFIIFNILATYFMDYNTTIQNVIFVLLGMIIGDGLVCVLTAKFEVNKAANMMAIDAIRRRG